MKHQTREIQLSSQSAQDGPLWPDMIDRGSLLFQWCKGESIAHLAREHSLPYHIVYRLIKSD